MNKEKIKKKMTEAVFTLGITVHDAMDSSKFKKSIDSVIKSYKQMGINKPINVLVSIDSEVEDEFWTQERTEEEIKNFSKYKAEKREYLKQIKRIIKKYKLNIDFDIIESTEKFGKVSASRNRIIDLCKTRYLVFLDGDDSITKNTVKNIVYECENNNLKIPKNRVNFRKRKEEASGPFDVIYFPKNDFDNNAKEVCGNIYDVNKIRQNRIRFTKQVGSEDGYIKAALYQNDFNVVYVENYQDEEKKFNEKYEPSNSTCIDDNKYFEEIIQLTNHLARHNRNSMILFHNNKYSNTNNNMETDPNNLFQYFNSGFVESINDIYSRNNCYGAYFSSNERNRIRLTYSKRGDIEAETSRCIISIICSIILYPEVLAEGEEKDFFMELRKKIINEKNKGGNSFSILNIMKSIKGYKNVIKIMGNNFESVNNFKNIINNDFDNYFNIHKEVFFNTISSLKINEGTKQIDKIKNPHLTGDASNISEIVRFKNYFSPSELKRRSDSVILLNKLLNGKFIPRELINDGKLEELRNDENKRSKVREIAIKYLFRIAGEEIKDIFCIIKLTEKYKKSEKIRRLVNDCYAKYYAINNPPNNIKYSGIERNEGDLSIKADKLELLLRQYSRNIHHQTINKKDEKIDTKNFGNYHIYPSVLKELIYANKNVDKNESKNIYERANSID